MSNTTVRFNVVAGYTAPNARAFVNGQYRVIGSEKLERGQDVDIRGTIIPASKITSFTVERKHIVEPRQKLDGFYWYTVINFRA
jgi:hypothetical protein